MGEHQRGQSDPNHPGAGFRRAAHTHPRDQGSGPGRGAGAGLDRLVLEYSSAIDSWRGRAPRFGFPPTKAPSDGGSVLLLLTVGLLLIGLVTLVIGFLNSSLALDYISIAASALSFALVLLFTRLGRARSARSAAARGRQAPAPLAQSDTRDTGLIELDNSDSLDPETAAYPRAS